jgi:hypothetical protein
MSPFGCMHNFPAAVKFQLKISECSYKEVNYKLQEKKRM